MRRRTFLACLPAAALNRAVCATGIGFEPSLESLRQYRIPEWYLDAKFGVYMHWGPCSIPEAGDWYAHYMYIQGSKQYEVHVKRFGHPSKFGFKDLIPLWKAERFDAAGMVKILRDAGVRYVSVLSSHHDGFDLYNSRFTRWNSVNMGPRQDLMRLWRDAIVEAGLRFGFNEHLARSYSWFQPSHGADKTGPLAGVRYDGADPKYQDLYHGPHQTPSPWNPRHYDPTVPDEWKQQWLERVQDVIDQYHPDFWFTDGALPFEKYGYAALSHFYNHNQRMHDGRLEAVFAFKDNKAGEFDERIGVLNIETNAISRMRDLPWQSGTHLGSVWYSSDAEWKSAEWVIHVLVDNVSKNGGLQLNIPPKPDGTYDDKVVAILRDAGAWLKVNGEAIFGTRAFSVYGEGPSMGKKLSTLTPLDIRFTKNKAGTALYAIVMGWPGDGAAVRIASLRVGAGVANITRVSLLGQSGVLRWTRDETGLTVTMPNRRAGEIAYPIRIESGPA